MYKIISVLTLIIMNTINDDDKSKQKDVKKSSVYIIRPSLKTSTKTFPYTPLFKKLLMTDTGMYSVTGVRGSKFIVDKIIYHIKTSHITITDGTANNGSDTVTFAQNFDKVNAIEIDPVNYYVLKNNISVYDFKNVTMYNDDTLRILDKLEQDVIYIDAPWGGTNYKTQLTLNLYLDDLEISYFFLKYKDKAKVMVFKVPHNYDFNYFINVIKTYEIHIYPYVDLSSKKPLRFYLIIIDVKKVD